MTLTAKDVAEITKLLEASTFDELYLELEGVKLSLRRGGAGLPPTGSPSPGPWVSATPPGSTAAAATPHAPEGSASVSSGHSPGAPGAAAAADKSAHDVPAPLLGTFYRAPKPGAPPFVEVGSIVEAGTIVGIIEVMKLMNTVRAGVAGRVIELVARDGALVEYGETLLRVGSA
ncbi:MAG: acetyl-CoA carboxylase biotin carboxyl carrier protein [Steroidobacteraceae bacterium]